MLNLRSAQTKTTYDGLDPLSNGPKPDDKMVRSRGSAGKISRAEWSGSIAALSIAILIVALYASVCFHWGGPRVTLLLISLVVTVWLHSVQRPWQSKA